MNKILLGLLLGALLGAIDGGTAWFTPAVRAQIVGIIIGSTVKGLIAGVAAGIFARKVNSVPLGNPVWISGRFCAGFSCRLHAARLLPRDHSSRQHRRDDSRVRDAALRSSSGNITGHALNNVESNNKSFARKSKEGELCLESFILKYPQRSRSAPPHSTERSSAGSSISGPARWSTGWL